MNETAPSTDYPGLHVGIIMDGNGRWAQRRGLPRLAGHRAGAAAVRRTVEAAPDLGVGTLTLYAFSADNWQRPRTEVAGLMRLFRTYLRKETERCIRNGVRVEMLGRRDRVSPSVRRLMEAAEHATQEGRTLRLRVAIDYSGRDEILEAARRLGGHREISREAFARELAGPAAGLPSPDMDLLVRTGGEHRLSDFQLWESAYAELVFLPVLWPDFATEDLKTAVHEFHRRERRFGRIPDVATA
ncbi:MAG: di-trans,poly-cis-decaprenylcistransferase [Acidobacteriota bacterium]